MDDIILQVKNVKKAFGGIQALKGVSLEVKRGEILALVGENGAGKSTLAKIVSGVLERDSGEIECFGKPVSFGSTVEARDAGVAIVLQEFNLIPHLSVAENIFLTTSEAYRGGFWLDRKAINEKTERLFQRISLDFFPDPNRRILDLSVAEQQLVEIVKAVSVDARLLILDEPSATLSKEEVKKLFSLIRALREGGVTVVFVSHRLEEIFEISDRIVVFRDGEKVREFETKTTKPEDLITSMVGRNIGDLFAIRKRRALGETMLEAKGLSSRPRVRDCSLVLRRGEVVGISGLVGAGRTELLRLLFGADRADSGELKVKGKIGFLRSPQEAIRGRCGMVPEDRKAHGILVNLPIYQNCSLAALASGGGVWISKRKEMARVADKVRELKIKAPEVKNPAGSLSGGNQQKVVLAKWLLTEPDILLLDEPTRGIDIGAKFEIYSLIDELAARGMAILLVSSELPEILALSDRILVMSRGSIVKELDYREASEEINPFLQCPGRD